MKGKGDDVNILFFTQEDPFYVKIFFDEFFKKCGIIDDIKAIIISKTMGKKSLYRLCKQMFELYGPFNFVIIGCKYIYYKLMSKRKIIWNNSPKKKTYSVEQTAKLYGIEVIKRSDLNSESFIKLVKRYDPDLFISIASPIIFKEKLIKTAKTDCINIHNAPLPKYRGMLPSFWQLYNGEKEAGITVHQIAKGIDTGDIIEQSFIPIDPKDTLDTLIKKTKKLNADMIIKVINDFKKRKVNYRKMENGGSYFTFPKRKDAMIFRKRGQRLI